MTKIEAVANVIVILLAVVMGSVYLKDRYSAPAPQRNQVKAGDRVDRLDGWDWAAHDRTLVLALRNGCHFCEDSAPFYQRLLSEQKRDGSSTAIVAAFPDAADAVKQAVQSEGLEVQALAGVPPEKLNVSGTPTLLLVDRSGTVVKAWIGVLSPKAELEVMKALACHDKRCREPA